jgi:hypothetical protein
MVHANRCAHDLCHALGCHVRDYADQGAVAETNLEPLPTRAYGRLGCAKGPTYQSFVRARLCYVRSREPNHSVRRYVQDDNNCCRDCECAPNDAPCLSIPTTSGAMVYDHEKLDYPGFAPFTAAGYFVAHSDFLREVPFDPFLPWIFMVRNNEITMLPTTRTFTVTHPTIYLLRARRLSCRVGCGRRGTISFHPTKPWW